MESDFVEICRKYHIATRIVPCSIEISYDKSSDFYSDIYEEEYIQIIDNNTDGFENYLEKLKSKNKIDGDSEVILEVLAHIYHRIVSIEKTIHQKEDKLCLLPKQGAICALGHGVICIHSMDFEVGMSYYLRFELPVFPKRMIGVFGEAIDRQVVKITKMHQKDIEDFDMYIANKEMENLRLKHKKDR